MKFIEWLIGPKGCLVMIVLGVLLMAYWQVARFSEAQSRVKSAKSRANMRIIESRLFSSESKSLELLAVQQLDHQNIKNSLGTEYSFLIPPNQDEIWFDPFSPRNKRAFAFFQQGSDWLIISTGPDEIFEAHPKYWWTTNKDENLRVLQTKSFDPSNGAFSPGDIFRSSVDKRDGDE